MLQWSCTKMQCLLFHFQWSGLMLHPALGDCPGTKIFVFFSFCLPLLLRAYLLTGSWLSVVVCVLSTPALNRVLARSKAQRESEISMGILLFWLPDNLIFGHSLLTIQENETYRELYGRIFTHIEEPTQAMVFLQRNLGNFMNYKMLRQKGLLFRSDGVSFPPLPNTSNVLYLVVTCSLYCALY